MRRICAGLELAFLSDGLLLTVYACAVGADLR